jgi:phenylpropionate dioxygenase-like ring-hydroxylating dioxygenase large terminal subunit
MLREGHGLTADGGVASQEGIRPDFLPKDVYISPEVVGLEAKRLWPKVWQVACREEEIKGSGEFVTYDVAGQSIIVVRQPNGTIKALHNACQHRGRRLTEGAGRTSKFHCRFHGWQYELDGKIARVLDRQDWEGCKHFEDDDISLKEVRVGTWAGFVYINMDPDAEPFEEFLTPVQEYINPFELQKMRYRWYKTTVLPCNWKTALEAFNEGYHVYATHPQLLEFTDDVTRTFNFGRHSMFAYPNARPFGAPSARLGKPMPDDIRHGLVGILKELDRTLKAMFSERSTHATTRLLEEVPAGTPPYEVLMKATEFQKEAAIAGGAGWPQLSFEQMGKAGADWHVFPNLVFLQTADAALVYRARPNGNNPDSCIFDIWSLVRYAPGTEPTLRREFYPDGTVNTAENFGLILSQDFQNMGEVQRGMHSLGFTGSRTNPLQESSVTNFHKALYQYIHA